MNEYSLVLTQILRGETPIAEYDRETGKLDFLPDCAKFRAPVVRWIKTQGFTVGKVAKQGEAVKSGKPSVAEIQAAKKLLQTAGLLGGDGEAPESTSKGKPSLLDFIAAGQPLPPGRTMDVPVDPIKSKRYAGAPPFGEGGDKTPDFVDWLLENYPEDAEKRYAGRKTHRD